MKAMKKTTPNRQSSRAGASTERAISALGRNLLDENKRMHLSFSRAAEAQRQAHERKATVAESVDVADLKSVAREGVPVRVRPVALLGLNDRNFGWEAGRLRHKTKPPIRVADGRFVVRGGLKSALHYFLAAFFAAFLAGALAPPARFSSMAAWAAARRATGTR